MPGPGIPGPGTQLALAASDSPAEEAEAGGTVQALWAAKAGLLGSGMLSATEPCSRCATAARPVVLLELLDQQRVGVHPAVHERAPPVLDHGDHVVPAQRLVRLQRVGEAQDAVPVVSG